MNDFDEMLNEVLHQDANPQTPSGLKERVIACLSVENKHTQNWRRVWVGIAAAMIVGLATWTLTRTRIASPVEAPSEVISLTRPNNSLAPIESHESELPKFDQEPMARRLMPRVRMAIPPHPHLQQRAIRIAPLEIEPIVIQPIEIASVSPSVSTRKGKIR